MIKQTYETSDLPLTAYLVLKGLTLLSAKKISGGRFEFILEDEHGVADQLKIEFVNSEFALFDSHIRSIKKLLYTK